VGFWHKPHQVNSRVYKAHHNVTKCQKFTPYCDTVVHLAARMWNATKQLRSAVRHKFNAQRRHFTLLLAEQSALRHLNENLADVTWHHWWPAAQRCADGRGV